MSDKKSAIYKIVLVTTVPETFATILKGQPKWLNDHFRVECITSSGSEVTSIAGFEGVAVHAVDMHRGISPVKDLVSIFKLWLKLRRLKPDAVHSYTPKAGMVSMLASLLAGVPVRIHTFTGLIFPTSNGFRHKILLLVDRLICLSATHIVPEGSGVKSDLIRYGVTNKELRVIGYGNIAGVDTQHFSPRFSRSNNISIGRDFVFCFVGRLNRDKGIQELVSAFVRLPGSPRLILVGKLDETAPVNRHTLDEIRTHERITCSGFLDDVRPVLALSNVLVLPSYREGFPNVILQAGAMGLPVIATDINGCNEIISESFNGWLVPPRDAASLLKCMEYSMSLSQEELDVLGANARKRVVERFDRDVYLQELLTFYRGIVL